MIKNFTVVILVDDGRTETITVEATDPWKARTQAMLKTTLRLNGSTVDYIVAETQGAL